MKIDSSEVQQELHGDDIQTLKVYGSRGEIGIPVLRSEAVGEHMAVDEKYIGQEFYTITTNADTGRIALMCRSIDYRTLVVALLRFRCETFNRVSNHKGPLCRGIVPQSLYYAEAKKRPLRRNKRPPNKSLLSKNSSSRDLDLFLCKVDNLL